MAKVNKISKNKKKTRKTRKKTRQNHNYSKNKSRKRSYYNIKGGSDPQIQKKIQENLWPKYYEKIDLFLGENDELTHVPKNVPVTEWALKEMQRKKITPKVKRAFASLGPINGQIEINKLPLLMNTLGYKVSKEELLERPLVAEREKIDLFTVIEIILTLPEFKKQRQKVSDPGGDGSGGAAD